MKKGNNIPEPKYKDDILDQLRHIDGVPAGLLRIEEYFNALTQHVARAADEIESLRNEVKQLQSEVKQLKARSCDCNCNKDSL